MSTPQPSNNNSNMPINGLPEWVLEMLVRKPPPFNLGLWSPPEDPDKPELPYIPGFTVQIHRHTAPTSFFEDCGAGKERRPKISEEYLKAVTQSKAIVDNPPLETAPLTQTETAQLTVTGAICTGAERGCQVLACSVTRQRELEGGLKPVETFHAAAKIYDPLYYRFKRSISNLPRDCSYKADEDYSVEAAAYEALEKAGQTGSFAPEYYECWTFNLPISIDGNHRTRPVRLILIEQLNGTNIRDTRIQNSPRRYFDPDSFHLPEEYRLEILSRAMEGYARQVSLGINQNDFTGRNIMLATPRIPATGTPDMVCGLCMPRVVLIDYNQARLDQASEPVLPVSPVELFWDGNIWGDFEGWEPLEWIDHSVMMSQWLLKRFYNDGKRQLYLALPDYLVEEAESLIRTGHDEPGELTI